MHWDEQNAFIVSRKLWLITNFLNWMWVKSQRSWKLDEDDKVAVQNTQVQILFSKQIGHLTIRNEVLQDEWVSIRITFQKPPFCCAGSQAEAKQPIRRLVRSLSRRQPRGSDSGLQCRGEGSRADHVARRVRAGCERRTRMTARRRIWQI